MANKIEIVVEGFNKFSGMFNDLNTGLDRMAKKFERSARASRKLALALGVVAAATGVLGLSMIKAAGRFEQSQIAFTTMLGSAEKAKKLLEDLANFARRTPFTLTGIEDATKKLLAYGITNENVLKDLERLGNVAAGVGMAKLPLLILAFGQVKAKGRLMGQEIRQFTESGVDVLQQLAKEMGVTAAEATKMVSQGKVSFDILRKVFINMTSEGGRFFNLMPKQAKALLGLWSNLEDAWGLFLRGTGLKMLEWSKEWVKSLIFIVDTVLPRLTIKVIETIKWLSAHKEVLIITAGVILGALTPAVIALAIAFAGLFVTLLPFMLAGAVIAGAIAGVVLLVKHWESIAKPVREFAAALKESLVGGSAVVSAAMIVLFSNIRFGFEVLTNFVKEKTLAAALWIADKLNVILPEAWQFDTSTLESNLETLKEKIIEPATTFAEAFENSKEAINGAFDFVGEKVDETKEYVMGSISEMWEGIKESLGDFFVGEEGILTPDKIISEETVDIVKTRWQTMLEEMSGHFKENLITIQDIAKSTWETFQKGAGDAVANAIVYGDDLGKAFSKMLRQIVANVISALIQMGIQRLAQSVLASLLNAKEATSRMAVLSAETYAGAFAATAVIPVIGPIIAPGVAAAATAAMLAGAVVSGASGASTGAGIAGVAHGGLENVPSEGTFLLNKGERVLAPGQNKDLENFMANGGGNINIEELNIMPGASITEELFEKPLEWWRELSLEKILPSLNILGEEGARTTLGLREGRI